MPNKQNNDQDLEIQLRKDDDASSTRWLPSPIPLVRVRIPVPQKNPADIMKEMDFVNMCAKFLQIGEVEITNIKKMRIAKRLVTDGMVHINLTL